MAQNLPTTENITLDAIEAEELQNVKSYLKKLYTIWENFGINYDQKIERGRVVWKHLRSLLEDILEEEISFYEDIKERIRNYTIKIEELSKILSVTPKQEDCNSLIKKEENLRLELDNLSKLKHKRIKSYQDLKSIELGYCSLLGMTEHQLSNSNGVPSEKDLIEIEQHVKMLKAERDKRYKKLCCVRRELTTILETTELTPETPFEKEILTKSDALSLTHETLKALEEVVCKAQKKKTELETQKKSLIEKLTALWNRLKVPDSKKSEFLSKHSDCKLSTLDLIQKELEKCEKIKRDNTKMYVNNLRQELKQLWEKCYASEAERQQFSLYSTDEITDNVLEAHEAEVEIWKLYYEKGKNIIIKIEKRKELWNLLLVFKNKAADPNRFKNRRGNLLKEEKERRKLQKDLPALENDIFCEIDLYETMHGKPFQYYGKDYREFVTNQWQERINQKENEKIERHKQRLMQTENEVTQGTPAKRPPSTPKSAPSKMLKSNTGMSVYRTPTSCKSKLTPNTIGKSALSASKFINSIQKSSVGCKLFASNSTRPNFILKKDSNILKERNKNKTAMEAANSTTYSQFANELNSTSRRSFRSSVISTRKVGGTRISNTTKNKRKSASKAVRKSLRNASKATSNLTPARGKLGLPFLI